MFVHQSSRATASLIAQRDQDRLSWASNQRPFPFLSVRECFKCDHATEMRSRACCANREKGKKGKQLLLNFFPRSDFFPSPRSNEASLNPSKSVFTSTEKQKQQRSRIPARQGNQLFSLKNQAVPFTVSLFDPKLLHC